MVCPRFPCYAAEADYHIDTALGEGNYRVMISGTSKANLDPSGENREPRSALSLFFDQALDSVVGAFLRLGWQREDAAVDFKAVYSGGLDFKGAAWGREGDNIGIGYAYLDGGNLENARSEAIEAYYRLALNDYLALTADVQYKGRLRGRERCRGLGPRHARRGGALETGRWEQAASPDGASIPRHPCRGRCGAGLASQVGQRYALRGKQEPCAEIGRG